jgi:hypothetical protein
MATAIRERPLRAVERHAPSLLHKFSRRVCLQAHACEVGGRFSVHIKQARMFFIAMDGFQAIRERALVVILGQHGHV